MLCSGKGVTNRRTNKTLGKSKYKFETKIITRRRACALLTLQDKKLKFLCQLQCHRSVIHIVVLPSVDVSLLVQQFYSKDVQKQTITHL